MSARASAGPPRAGAADVAADLLALLDALPANVALWDEHVRLRYANRRQLSRFGRPPAELLGVHLSELVQPHAVELSAQYILGALAGVPQQVERAMVDAKGQRYNAHQVTHVPNVVDGKVCGYCALAIDITDSIEGYEHARRAREEAALRAERDRIAGDLDEHRVVDELSAALRRLDAALDRAADAVPSLSTAAEAIERTIEELRETVPNHLARSAEVEAEIAAFPTGSPTSAVPFDDEGSDAPPGVTWPPEITGRGWTADQVRALLDLLPAAVAIWDSEFRNVFANRAAVRWFGRRGADEIHGRTAEELLGTAIFADNLPHARAALAGDEQRIDRTVLHSTGLRHVQATYVPRLVSGEVTGLYTFVVDVTARVEAELALQDARARLASARERQRIADELHNMVIQRLFAAGLAASLPAQVTESQLRSVQDGITAALAELESALGTLQENVRTLDLLPALARVVHEAADPRGIAAVIENVGSVDYVPPALGAELLVVTEEALTNVVTHSGARNVVVTVAVDAASAWLRIVDDGRGLGGSRPGASMTDMQDRAERLGGSCAWRSIEPSGTLIDWRVPLVA